MGVAIFCLARAQVLPFHHDWAQCHLRLCLASCLGSSGCATRHTLGINTTRAWAQAMPCTRWGSMPLLAWAHTVSHLMFGLIATLAWAYQAVPCIMLALNATPCLDL